MEAFMNKTFKSYFLLTIFGLGFIATPCARAYGALDMPKSSTFDLSCRGLNGQDLLKITGVFALAAGILYYCTRTNEQQAPQQNNSEGTQKEETEPSSQDQEKAEATSAATDQTSLLSAHAVPLHRPLVVDSFDTTPLHAGYSDHFPVLADSGSLYTQTSHHVLDGFSATKRFDVTSYNDHFPVLPQF
jgi:hypothetical protein